MSLQPSATLTLRDLGLLDRLVACTRYCADVCPEVGASSCHIVSDSWTAQSAEITSARPDLVLASVPYQIEAVGEILKAGIRFLGLAPRNLRDIYTDIMAIAGILGVPEKGQAIIHKMQEALADVRRKTENQPRQRVFSEEWGKPLIASQPWIAEMVESCRGEFVGEPGKTTTAAAVAASQPQVLLAAWCGAGDRVPLEKIVAQREWTGIPAVRERRVFCVRDELFNTPASNLIEGLHCIAWALHPGLFDMPHGIRALAPV